MAVVRCIVGVLIACLCAACTNGDVCTTNFAIIQVAAVTPSGEPVTGLAIRDSLVRTGQAFDVEQMPNTRAGEYQVFHDGLGHRLPRSTEAVYVTGTDATRGFSANFVFEAGECHVIKRGGPDTVVVAPLQ